MSKSYVGINLAQIFYHLCYLMIVWWVSNLSDPNFVIIWQEVILWKFSIWKYMKNLANRFRNLFCRAYFGRNDKTCTCWILMYFRNTWLVIFFCFCDFKTQTFSIFCIFLYFLITNFMNFAASVFPCPITPASFSITSA